jgi:hypothetical protein
MVKALVIWLMNKPYFFAFAAGVAVQPAIKATMTKTTMILAIHFCDFMFLSL